MKSDQMSQDLLPPELPPEPDVAPDQDPDLLQGPQDHPLRYALTNELHARPFPRITAPTTLVYIAVKQPDKAVNRDRSADLAHLVALLDRHGLAPPRPDATHHAVQLGRHWLKWEQHAEFVSYTLYCSGLSARAFDPADFDAFPRDWLRAIPGQRMTSMMLRVLPRGSEAEIKASAKAWFVPESTVISNVLDDSITVAGDFRIDASGHMRFAMFVDPKTGPQRVGRVAQRLCEIETYRAMSMLGFSRARAIGPDLLDLDAQLSGLMAEMTQADTEPTPLLSNLLTISAKLEAMAAQASFRFDATGAYEALVSQRIGLLREENFAGYQTMAEFMMRRFDPAMRTVKTVENRLRVLADRARRAGELLRTRVDVTRSAQSHLLLERMDRRADLALRLQHTVEGLSVVAISYYAVSLASYTLYPIAPALGLSKNLFTALISVPVIAIVWLMVRQVRKSLH